MKHLTDNEIQSYLHGLPAGEREYIEHHLNECPDCQKQLLFYKKLGEVVISASTAPAPEDFETAVMGRLRAVRRLKRITDFLVAAVGIGGFAIIGLFILLTPQLRFMVSESIIEVWQYGSEVVKDIAKSSETTAIIVFAAGLFAFFSIIDRLIIGKLRLAAGRKRYSETG